jgi:hypothetical protein
MFGLWWPMFLLWPAAKLFWSVLDKATSFIPNLKTRFRTVGLAAVCWALSRARHYICFVNIRVKYIFYVLRLCALSVFSYISYWAELLSRENQAQMQGAGVLMMVRFTSSMIPSEEHDWRKATGRARRVPSEEPLPDGDVSSKLMDHAGSVAFAAISGSWLVGHCYD